MRKSVLFFAGLAACAGATPAPSNFNTPTGGGGGGAAAGKPGGAADVSLDLAARDLKGVFFEPEALGLPGMPMVQAKKKMTLDKHRAEIAKAKDPVVKQAEAAIVATMLYERSKNETGDAQKKTREEARQVLRDVQAAVGNKVDDTVLRMLGSYELLLEDYPASEKAWSDLVALLGPKDKEEPGHRAWWAYSLMKQGKNADALQVITADQVSEKQPDHAYITAWAKWRAGDGNGAWQAIVTAAKGWGANANHEVLERDLLLFAGRTNVAMGQAMPDLSTLLGKSKDQQYKIDSDLGLRSYQFAGRWKDGVDALEAAIQTGGAKVPPEDVPTIRYFEAVFTVPLVDPSQSSKFAKAAIDALPTCGAKCDAKIKDNLIQSVYGLARLFHLLYATANDSRYQQPALDLYNLAIESNLMAKASADQAFKERDQLQRTIKTLKPTDGTHDKQALGALLQHHDQEVQACYEQVLSGSPKLAGQLTLNLESDQTGAIKGVSTDPKEGKEPMSAVAACVADRAHTWKLPTRARAGSTRIKATYNLAPRK